jgi:hypothetical protein
MSNTLLKVFKINESIKTLMKENKKNKELIENLPGSENTTSMNLK